MLPGKVGLRLKTIFRDQNRILRFSIQALLSAQPITRECNLRTVSDIPEKTRKVEETVKHPRAMAQALLDPIGTTPMRFGIVSMYR